MPKYEIPIIYSDEDIIVVNKPTGLSVTKDRAGQPDLPKILAEGLGVDKKTILLVHRLDKETSGVMILARNTPAQRTFTEYFSTNSVKKTYLALVRGGSVAIKTGTIDAPIGPDKKDDRFMRIDHSKNGKQATTNWELLADFGGVSLVAVRPVTGRTHQIRVHMPAAGMPLVVDPLYGSIEGLMLSEFKHNYRVGKFQEERPLIERLTLHAYQIELPPQPAGRPNIFVAGLDKKFGAAIKMLTKHNPRHHESFLDQDIYEKIIAAQQIDSLNH